MTKRPFIIDCDTGTDDAIAIIAALYCEDIEVKAITSVNGNVRHCHTSKNNLDLIEYLNFHDKVKVAKGASLPMYDRGDYYGLTHGKTGLGNVNLPDAKSAEFDDKNAVDLIYEEALRQNGNLELLVIGPMTNIAMLISLYPDICSYIKHIYFMGGACRGGNVTPTAEFNIWVDPIAANIVFNSGISMTMVGLDVTEKAVIDKPTTDRIRNIGSDASSLVATILDYMHERHDGGGEDALMHDALALAAAVHEKCLGFVDAYVCVECRGDYTAGHTMVDLRNKLNKKPNMRVALSLELESFREFLFETILNSKELKV